MFFLNIEYNIYINPASKTLRQYKKSLNLYTLKSITNLKTLSLFLFILNKNRSKG